MSESTRLTVNGVERTIAAAPDTPLLYVLRNDLKLKGAKFGCGLGQCGSCMVLIEGRATTACDTPLSAAAGKAVTTIEALGEDATAGALQRAFVAEQAVQCGYCASGMIVAATALLARNAQPSESDIVQALAGNLCRCGTHVRIVRAIRRASEHIAREARAGKQEIAR